MPINLTNRDDIELFVNDNIQLINNNISIFSKKNNANLKYDKTDIRRHLKSLFIEYISDDTKKQDLLARFQAKGYVKKYIVEIAIDVKLYHTDLEKFYQNSIFEDLSKNNRDEMCDAVIDTILEKSSFSDEKKYYAKLQLKTIIDKALYMSFKNGFTFNLNNAEEGIMTANAGDSAQFLFLARAILAGYNCSNVDVRSSRYDAVIDKNGHLYRVQVKGISDKTLHFKDRDRGGRGIDAENERNRGKRISSSDCDLYVAVDKQLAICYIIPTTQIEAWNKDTISVSEAAEYRENWKAIDDLAE